MNSEQQLTTALLYCAKTASCCLNQRLLHKSSLDSTRESVLTVWGHFHLSSLSVCHSFKLASNSQKILYSEKHFLFKEMKCVTMCTEMSPVSILITSFSPSKRHRIGTKNKTGDEMWVKFHIIMKKKNSQNNNCLYSMWKEVEDTQTHTQSIYRWWNWNMIENGNLCTRLSFSSLWSRWPQQTLGRDQPKTDTDTHKHTHANCSTCRKYTAL